MGSDMLGRELERFWPFAQHHRMEILRHELDAFAAAARSDRLSDVEQLLARAEPHMRAVRSLPSIRKGPLVSVIMPVWNRAELVAGAIESVLTQSYRNWELIVVDDGSTDDSVSRIADYLGDRRVRLVETRHNGVSSARNEGLVNSRAEFVAYLDSDNLWFSHYLQEIVRAFCSPPYPRSLFCAQVVDDMNLAPGLVRDQPYKRDALEEANFIDLNVFAHRRHLIDDYGVFDPLLDRAVDWDLILRYTRDVPPARIPVLGGIYLTVAENRISDIVPVQNADMRIRAKLSGTAGSAKTGD